MTVSDPSTALARQRSHVECLSIHIMGAHDALPGCAVELAALADSGHIRLYTNCEGSHALLF